MTQHAEYSPHSEFVLNFPTAHGEPLATATIKFEPQDFIVEETLAFPLSGSGEHLYLYVRKTNANTDWVSQQLARYLGVRQRDIGYAGLKDRHGVTTQWFSLPAKNINTARLDNLQIEGVELCEVTAHHRKLRKGAIKQNHFSLRIRDFDVEQTQLQARLEQINIQGVPNYFDEQRFGHDRANLTAAQAMFSGRAKPARFQRGLYLSAARAWLFNAILAQRITEHTWLRALPGDVFWLEGTRRFFTPEHMDDELQERITRGDIHPTGALWGSGTIQSGAEVARLENGAVARWQQLAQGLIDAGLTQDRRPLRVMPKDLRFEYMPSEKILLLDFALPSGAYATALLHELLTRHPR